MAFEFFFGIFGLISSDSKSRHKSRLENDWRMFTPLGASLFGEQGGKSTDSFKDSASSDSQKPIFSTSGTMTYAKSSGTSEGLLSSASSAASINSSGSSSSVGSRATLIKSPTSSPLDGKKYEFFDREPSLGASKVGGLLDDKLGEHSLDSGLGSPSGGKSGGAASSQTAPPANKWRVYYCRLVCVMLWLQVLRLLAGLIVERSILTLDFYHLGAYRIHFVIPALCLSIEAAAVALIFARNNDETNWLIPFYSSKDYLIRSRSNFRPKIEDYTKRVNVSIVLALVLATASSLSLAAHLIHCSMEPVGVAKKAPAAGTGTGSAAAAAQLSDVERTAMMLVLAFDIVWAVYSSYICFLVSFYFNLICSIMRARFREISKIIEDLAESNTSKTTNQARKVTTLYLEHNEACELLDESNDFWQYLIFFTYFTYIPAYCYCLYNLFFVDFDTWPSFITWVIHFHTGFIILLISFSAAGVSTEAHAPYTSLHTLSLIQLPLDVEVNIATFLHRVRGLTIGYSCYDLFAITNASMSNTAAACASYFLIVADFSRSSMFNLAQMNMTGGAGGNAAAAAAAATAAPPLALPEAPSVG